MNVAHVLSFITSFIETLIWFPGFRIRVLIQTNIRTIKASKLNRNKTHPRSNRAKWVKVGEFDNIGQKLSIN